MLTTPELTIVGTGRVAQALGNALLECGMRVVAVAGRSRERAVEAAAFVGGGAEAMLCSEAGERAERVVIAVSDGALEAVAAELAAHQGRIRVALHTSGNAGPEVLAALAQRGVSCGAIHPLQTIPSREAGAAALRGISFAVSGRGEALEFAGQIAARLEGRTLRIADGAQPLYHAAAVMASNYITALLDAAVESMALTGVTREEALEALAPLARAAVENAVRSGPVEALTGPVARGDASTVAAHVRAIGEASGALLPVYRSMGLRALHMARRRGLTEAAAGRVEEAFGSKE
ncbi:MAG: DUF2520 domain-containing protein [Acidobacteria bacterium]|nr:DUF2520 domain-containing protein [Acidobacteriota bacterium]